MDDIFFIISKLAWGLLSPSNLFIVLLIIAVLALLKGFDRLAKVILMPTVFLATSLMVYPWGEWLIYPLETRFERPETLPDNIDGIIVLGGSEKLKNSVSWQTAQIGESGDRYIAAAYLAKHYPNAPVLFTGGSGLLRFQNKDSEGDIAQSLLTTVGIEAERLLIESQSRNTYENMQLIQDLLPNRTGQYVLVTSAFHMPRSVGLARAQNINAIPYPTDYRSNKPALRQWSMQFYEHLEVLEPAWKEWIGLTIYYLTGKTQAFFPSPEAAITSKNISQNVDSDKL